MKRIGILGGTFDPIHIGHLVAADQALFYGNLDEVWFMPTFIPPHKQDSEITEVKHRLEMAKRVVSLDERYKLCTVEIEREGTSYTIDTIKQIKNRYPKHDFNFIIGGDMIKYLPKWYQISELVQLIQFIGLERPGYTFDTEDTHHQDIFSKVKIIPMPQLEISSSQIRSWIKEGRNIRYVVPQVVEEYIREHRIYEG